MKLKVVVDPQLCIGAASCIVVDPDHFELNAEGKAEVKSDAQSEMQGYELTVEVDEEGKQRLLEGAQACPTQAIFVYAEDGTQLFPA